MPAAAILALLAGFTPASQNQTAPIQPQVQTAPSNLATVLSTQTTIAEPFRLQLTPTMDGKILDEDWDAFASGPNSKTYFQWAPSTIFVAGSAPVGSDLLVSLDLGNDGWLVGSNNFEARLSADASGNPSLSVRRLNAKNVAGPIWENLPGWAASSIVKATVAGGQVQYELQLTDAGLGVLPKKPGKIAARVDMISSSEPPISSTQPRVLSTITLDTSRADGLPSNLKYQMERTNSLIVAGDPTSMRFNFTAKGTAAVKKININTEGPGKVRMNDMTSPFPEFDKKGHAFIDYVSKVSPDMTAGYHVLKATLTLGDDTPATVEASYRVSEPITIEMNTPLVPAGAQDRSVTINFTIHSYTNRAMKGTVGFTFDPKFKVLNRSSETYKFAIEQRGKVAEKFQMFVPSNSTGTYPITFDLNAGPNKVKIVRFITIAPSEK